MPFETGKASLGLDLPLRPEIVGFIGSFRDHLAGYLSLNQGVWVHHSLAYTAASNSAVPGTDSSELHSH